jgi:hypothetical protein
MLGCCSTTIYSALLCTARDNRGSLGLLHPIFSISVLSPPAILCISEEYASPSGFLLAASLDEKSQERIEMRF